MPLGTILLILLVLVLIGLFLPGAIAAPGDTDLPEFSVSFS